MTFKFKQTQSQNHKPLDKRKRTMFKTDIEITLLREYLPTIQKQ